MVDLTKNGRISVPRRALGTEWGSSWPGRWPGCAGSTSRNTHAYQRGRDEKGRSCPGWENPRVCVRQCACLCACARASVCMRVWAVAAPRGSSLSPHGHTARRPPRRNVLPRGRTHTQTFTAPSPLRTQPWKQPPSRAPIRTDQKGRHIHTREYYTARRANRLH